MAKGANGTDTKSLLSSEWDTRIKVAHYSNRLARSAGRNGERLKDIEESVDAIKHALNIKAKDGTD